MSKLDEKVVIDSISKIGTEVDRIKGLNEELIKSLGLENVLERLNKSYLKDKGCIGKSKRQIYVKTFEEEKPLIVDSIFLWKDGSFFIIAVLNGQYLYVTSLRGTNGGMGTELLERHLIEKDLLKNENLDYFKGYEIIDLDYLKSKFDKGVREDYMEIINNRIARVFFETFLGYKALFNL